MPISNIPTNRPLAPGVIVDDRELRMAPGTCCPHPHCGVEITPRDAQETADGWRIVCRNGHEFVVWG